MVHSETSIKATPEGFDDAGFRVGTVDLGEDRVTARIDGDEVSLSGGLTEMAEPAPIFKYL